MYTGSITYLMFRDGVCLLEKVAFERKKDWFWQGTHISESNTGIGFDQVMTGERTKIDMRWRLFAVGRKHVVHP